MNYDHNKKFGLFKFHSGYGNCFLNSPNGYSRKIINAQTIDSTYQKVFRLTLTVHTRKYTFRHTLTVHTREYLGTL